MHAEIIADPVFVFDLQMPDSALECEWQPISHSCLVLWCGLHVDTCGMLCRSPHGSGLHAPRVQPFEALAGCTSGVSLHVCRHTTGPVCAISRGSTHNALSCLSWVCSSLICSTMLRDQVSALRSAGLTLQIRPMYLKSDFCAFTSLAVQT